LVVALGMMAGWGGGCSGVLSKSKVRTKAGDEEARRLLGDGVAGVSESEISSICVHSLRRVWCWEAEPRGLGLGILRKICCGWVLITGCS
jgi:hypothetical protein